MEDVKRKKFTIQYVVPGRTEFFIVVIAAIDKIEAKTLFIANHPGCQIRCILEE